MRFFILILIACICLQSRASQRTATDVYIVIYATYKGRTGHAGIAIDKYKIVYREVKTAAGIVYKEDTVKTGELIYYDFWPNDDYFNKMRTAKDIPGVSYRLPDKLFEEITPNSLLSAGIPHKEHYPCDALLRIATGPSMDHRVMELMDSVVQTSRTFNARRFNCTDFVLVPLQLVLQRKIKVKEFVPVSFSSTPNKLYRQLKKDSRVEVLRSADRQTAGSFLKERVLYRYFH